MESVSSYSDFISRADHIARSFLVLYKPDSESGTCMLQNLEPVADLESADFRIFTADVKQVRDIHEKFGVSSVPALLIFENGKFRNVSKGCQNEAFYSALARNAIFSASAGDVTTHRPSVTVYTTPTCSWCNTLKAYLRKNNVFFTEVDVSRDETAAKEMVSRSGQQGVPQTDINGEMIVGFNQNRIKELLKINS